MLFDGLNQHRNRLILLSCGLILGGVQVFAQQLSISGTVSDSTGAIPEVAITLKDPSGAATRQTTTDSSGKYIFDGLPSGSYTLSFARSGFETATRTVAVASESQSADVTLTVSGVATSIEVRGVARDAIQLEAPAAGGTRLDLPVIQLPASLSIITQELIQEQGARTGNEAVQLAVGMTAGTSVGSIPSFATRGFASNNITLMRDGIRQDTVSQSSTPL